MFVTNKVFGNMNDSLVLVVSHLRNYMLTGREIPHIIYSGS